MALVSGKSLDGENKHKPFRQEDYTAGKGGVGVSCEDRPVKQDPKWAQEAPGEVGEGSGLWVKDLELCSVGPGAPLLLIIIIIINFFSA